MINSKQRSYLRSMANRLDPILIIGKDGIDENVIKQVEQVLEPRELIKIKVLKNSFLDARDACTEVCKFTGAEPVQTIGNKFVIYRESKENPTITLP